MTSELVDYRLARYRARTSGDTAGGAFSCILIWNQRDPILKLPSRVRSPGLPAGETDVRLPDGAIWRFRFAKEFCNVARPYGTDRNQLPDLMRRWFGPAAGHPGTRFEVRFSRSPDGWWIEPLGKMLSLPARGRVLAYPSLRAAAGAAADARPDAPDAEEVALPFEGITDDTFAVRAAGDSMNGGKTPIGDGDWLVMRWARGAGLPSVAGRVALVKTPDEHGGFAYQVKRIFQEAGHWWLRSDNPERAAVEATAGTIPIALLVSSIAPETLAPTVGELLAPEEVGVPFGLASGAVVSRNGRYDGHLFLFVTDKGRFTEPDRLEMVVSDRRPGETAFVLARAGGEAPWRYCGVGRWGQPDEQWSIPPLDFATWRALGQGRNASRRLPVAALERATTFIGDLLRRNAPGTWFELDGKRCRLLETTANGVRIDGEPRGFEPRQVTPTDLAWVMLAGESVATGGRSSGRSESKPSSISGRNPKAVDEVDRHGLGNRSRGGHPHGGDLTRGCCPGLALGGSPTTHPRPPHRSALLATISPARPGNLPQPVLQRALEINQPCARATNASTEWLGGRTIRAPIPESLLRKGRTRPCARRGDRRARAGP